MQPEAIQCSNEHAWPESAGFYCDKVIGKRFAHGIPAFISY